jgi:peptidyl-prolyl cis-trans isomerase C
MSLVSGLLPLALGLAGGLGCDDKALDDKKPATAATAHEPGKLPPELKSRVLAKVGDKEITLGDYAATLERMDQFERLRYQSADRRRDLLDEIIKVELLAAEARRRGLHEEPEVKERLRLVLRDEVLREARSKLPTPAEIPESEVRKYYEEHRDDFRDPERRRVSHIVMKSEADAKKVLEQARGASPKQWGELVKKHSLEAAAAGNAPLELAGDLGIVGAPGTSRGDNPRVPEPVRKAVFQIDSIGGVHSELVVVDGKLHIVRMTGKTEARDRALAEAERTIRVALLHERLDQVEKKLEAELRKKYEVKVDEAALKKVDVPSLEQKDASDAGKP